MCENAFNKTGSKTSIKKTNLRLFNKCYCKITKPQEAIQKNNCIWKLSVNLK